MLDGSNFLPFAKVTSLNAKLFWGITLNIAAAVLASPYGTEILAREGAPEAQRHMPILLAWAG